MASCMAALGVVAISQLAGDGEWWPHVVGRTAFRVGEIEAMIASIIGLIYLLFEIAAIVAAGHAVLSSRTPQGSIAWVVALLSLPLISLPMYLVFGRSRFHGLVNLRRAGDQQLNRVLNVAQSNALDFVDRFHDEIGNAQVLTRLSHVPFLRGNDTRLLIDGAQTFESMFEAIDGAQEYVLAEFFIVKDDQLGRQFQSALIEAARRGCRVYLLFDEVGSQSIRRSYVRQLEEAGVRVSGVKSTAGGWVNRFQLNFRNHRKIVVVDGHVSFVGGLNVGDEYVHRSPRLTPWRDTHLRMEGPATLAVQFSFVEDWYWATREIPKLNWSARAAENADRTVLVLPSGPDDDYETCGLFFCHAINSARTRIWIASPYFVPDLQILSALKLAALRGVDVRVMLPEKADHRTVYLASFSYYQNTLPLGIKIYRYTTGFMHQKVFLIDSAYAAVGTANLDNRSFRLNFEITLLNYDSNFIKEIEDMLTADFSRSRPVTIEDYTRKSFFFKLAVRSKRLLAPIL